MGHLSALNFPMQGTIQLIDDNQLSIPESADERIALPDLGQARNAGQRPAKAADRSTRNYGSMTA